MKKLCNEHGGCAKKTWSKPVLEVLSVRDTAFCEYVFNPDTGFYQEVCWPS